MSENELKQTNEPEENKKDEFVLDTDFSKSSHIPKAKDDITQEDINHGRTMALLSYIIPIIPYISEERKKNNFIKFHSTQGMNLFLIFIIYTVVYNILTMSIKITHIAQRSGIMRTITPWWITLPLSALGCVLAVLDIIGIVQVLNGEANELPIVKDLKIFKK